MMESILKPLKGYYFKKQCLSEQVDPTPTRNKFLIYSSMTTNKYFNVYREYIERTSNSNISANSSVYSKRNQDTDRVWYGTTWVLFVKKAEAKLSCKCNYNELEGMKFGEDILEISRNNPPGPRRAPAGPPQRRTGPSGWELDSQRFPLKHWIPLGFWVHFIKKVIRYISLCLWEGWNGTEFLQMSFSKLLSHQFYSFCITSISKKNPLQVL